MTFSLRIATVSALILSIPSCGTPQHGARTIAGVGPGEPSPQALAPTAQPASTTVTPAEPKPEPEREPEPVAESPAEAPTAQHQAARPAP